MSKKTMILLGFVIVKFIFQYNSIHVEYELHRDEFLHLDQAHHLAWGYLSVPPVTSWISYLIYLLGNRVFWVKFFPALFGALTIVLVWKIIEELKGNLFALILGATAILFSAIMRINILYQPNSLDILMWTCFYYTLIKYIHTEDIKWLYVLAVTFAIGFLNKYNIVFLLAGLIPAILVTKQRKIFVCKHLYLAAGLCFMLILPNLVWQYQNNFPVIRHMEELADTQLINIDRIDFLKGQLPFFINSIYLLPLALAGFWFYEPLRKYKFFFWNFLFVLFLYTFLRAKSYYAIGLYPVYIGLGAAFLGHILDRSKKQFLQPAVIILTVLLFIPVFRVAMPIESPEKIRENPELYKKLGLLRWEDGKEHDLPQDFADMLGWKELAGKVDKAMSITSDKEHTLVLCNNYGEAGAINYYSANRNMAAVSFSADYVNWFCFDREIKSVILIRYHTDRKEDMTEEKQLFETIVFFDEVIHPYAREKDAGIYILKDPKTDINEVLKEKIRMIHD